MGASRYVYGVHAAEALLESRPGAVVSAKLLAKAAEQRLAGLLRALEGLGVPVERVSRGELDRLSGGAAHQGIVIETRPRRDFDLPDFEALVAERGRTLCTLVLDGVQDPRNLGACLRTAEAAGVDAVVVPRSRAAGLGPAALKTAAGAAETVPLLRAPNLARTLRWLRDAGVWIVGADAGADASLYEISLSRPMAVVLGGEGRGLRRLTRTLCDELVAIPMQGTAGSLNVSVAAGVVLFELRRRWAAAGFSASDDSRTR